MAVSFVAMSSAPQMCHRYPMLYQMFQMQDDLAAQARAMAALAARMMGLAPPWARDTPPARGLAATLDILASARATHARPPFGIEAVAVGNREVAVHEQVVRRLPFADLLRFGKDTDIVQPRVLVVAPLSGHFATLLRGTITTMLPDHDVHVTDWRNARDVPLSEGRFGMDEFVAHLVACIEAIGPGGHVVAVCQPVAGVLAAAALLAEARSPAQPASITLMAGPVDTRLNPTRVNDLAQSKSLDWFERNVITTVPARHAGAGRRVYPGFMQLAAFLSMNPARHRKAFADHHASLVADDADKVALHRRFYDEYFAVMDLDADFFLETIEGVFQNHDLARNEMTVDGRRIDLAAIRRTALLTVEGELDDICAMGQTMAALDLCVGVPPFMKRHHLQAGVGHYGVFSGRRWATQVYPRVRDLIQATTRA